ncbi:MAG: hypothetical protein KDG55_16320, partial [Rhodocyclaceae bacterium]|nr:hypothetical protein [Rhodocyclaceae bacterium]
EQLRRRALAPLPAGMSRPLALRQALTGRWGEGGAPDLRQALVDVDRASLAAGLQVLAAALAGLRDALAQAHAAAGLVWEAETALGRVLIDLGTTDDERSLVAPLLLVDGGGDDRYHFLDDTRRPAIALLLDLAGRDHYASAAPAAGVPVGLLGYGLLWDAGRDDDRYDGADLDQAAAVLGGAVLVDEGGNDHYAARGHAQAFAMGGLAVLLDRAGDDRYEALTFAQASAGPAAVALLVDAAGDDRYRLAAEPLVAPSAQRPDLNVSAGQGMGIGIRADHLDGRSLAGGLGVLLDGGGDDDYQATVFAQGAGYWRGGGLLFDRGGQDHYQAIWYGQAAAAHAGLGLLIDRGRASDRYQASQSTSMAAAHDGALAMLLDEGGDDDYRLGDLGLGAAHDTGVALFADLDGDDRYAVSSEACRAFGAAIAEQPDGPAAVPNLGLFMDLGGTDRYGCGLARNDQRWTWPGGGDGAGFDGVAPFRLETGTVPAPAGPAAPPRPWREAPRGRSWP